MLQLRVSLRFTAPRYDAYCKIWVKKNIAFFFHLYQYYLSHY